MENAGRTAEAKMLRKDFAEILDGAQKLFATVAQLADGRPKF